MDGILKPKAKVIRKVTTLSLDLDEWSRAKGIALKRGITFQELVRQALSREK